MRINGVTATQRPQTAAATSTRRKLMTCAPERPGSVDWTSSACVEVGRCQVNECSEPRDRSRGASDFSVSLPVLALFDALAHGRDGLDAVARVKARRINKVTVPFA